MRRGMGWRVLLWVLAGMLWAGLGPSAWAEEEKAEWTVMFYFCGSDLESRNAYASGNLEEIAACYPYAALRNLVQAHESIQSALEIAESAPDIPRPDVNVVIQTGGSREWHAQELGMDIAADRLQRWEYAPTEMISPNHPNQFILRQECPLASMAKPETLADFIRWSEVHYPAEKYALVLWGHGQGSQAGVLMDELFDQDAMNLGELRQALEEGGVTFETLLFDACLMANLETACAVQDAARWMVASQELVAGTGTAVEEWLQWLYVCPDWDGKRLGKAICETTQKKYANAENDQALETMTWSVIDLSKVSTLAERMEVFFQRAGECYEKDQEKMTLMIGFFDEAWEFGKEDGYRMMDLGSAFDQLVVAILMDRELHRGIMEALEETIVYNLRSEERYSVSGLSFCNAVPLTPEQLDVYARNCPFPHYLAFLDAINLGWTAPDWVYEKAERLRDIREMEIFRIEAEKIINDQGVPSLRFDGNASFQNIGNVYVRLYWLNPETGNVLRLGCRRANDLVTDGEASEYALKQAGMWPAVEGTLCDMELIWDEGDLMDYLIPIRMGTEVQMIRCTYDAQQGDGLTITGLWQGYDVDSTVSSRGAMSLSEVSGVEFSLLYPIDGSEARGGHKYESSAPMTMYRMLEMKEQPLPAGTYYLEYLVEDPFYRLLDAGRVEVQWDGETITLPHPEDWQGTILLEHVVSSSAR